MYLDEGLVPVSPERVGDWLALSKALFAVLVRQPGCIWVRRLRSIENPDHFRAAGFFGGEDLVPFAEGLLRRGCVILAGGILGEVYLI